jgi:hypothetical protein
MTDDGPDSIVLRYLRRIDERTERMERRLDELPVRTGRLELRSWPPVCTSTSRPCRAGWTASTCRCGVSSAAWSCMRASLPDASPCLLREAALGTRGTPGLLALAQAAVLG